MIRTALAAGHLHRVHVGVYRMGCLPTTGHEHAMAAVLAGGKGALLSHLWALWLYALGRLPTTDPDVSVPRSREERPGLEFHRRRTMPEADENFGIPVTTPAQTLADCAPLLSEQQLRAAANRALINHLTNRDKLMVFPALRTLVSEHGATRSVLEDLLFDLSRELETDHERRLHLEARGERVTSVTHRQVTRLRTQTRAQLAAVLSA